MVFYLVNTPWQPYLYRMLNLLSLLVGAVGLLIALVGLLPIPLLPLVNWFAFPIAIVGVALGVLSDRNEGRNLNLLVAVLSGGRLFLTWGLI
tara:strand:- start:1123 stop:1398 length:276 start_codon:yes stop_codon:yes gene_type:complete